MDRMNVPFLAVIRHGITEGIIHVMNASSIQNPSLTFSFIHEIKTGKFGFNSSKILLTYHDFTNMIKWCVNMF